MSTDLAVGADLEVISLQGDGPAATLTTGNTRRRWPWATVGVAVVAGLLVMPVRADVAGSQFRHLAGVWAAAQALEPARQKGIEQLTAATVAYDAGHLAHGTAALDDDEAARLQALRGRLDSWMVPDRQLERLRAQMRQAMLLEMADLRAAAAELLGKVALPDSPFTAATIIEQDIVSRQLAELRLRFDQQPAVASAPAELNGAGDDLAALHHYLDEPTGTILVAADGSRQLRLVDLDHSRISTLDLGSDTSASQVVTRSGYIAVLVQTPGAALVLAANPAAAGPARILARQVTAITAAPEPDRLWAATDHGAVEVDGTGAVIAGPIRLPADADLAGATTATLYSQRQNGQLLATSLADGSTRVIANLGELIATRGSAVAWAAATRTAGQISATLNLSTDSGKTSHVLLNAADTSTFDTAIAIGPGDFSPDGRYLALWWLERFTELRSNTVFAVVDLGDGRGQRVGGTTDALVPRAVAWAPDSRRVFFVRGEQVTQLWSYQPGTGRAEAVRIRGVETDEVAAIASPAA